MYTLMWSDRSWKLNIKSNKSSISDMKIQSMWVIFKINYVQSKHHSYIYKQKLYIKLICIFWPYDNKNSAEIEVKNIFIFLIEFQLFLNMKRAKYLTQAEI